jgi:hypothetical protein
MEIKLNTKIYKEKAIKQAISSYSHIARFKVKNNKNYINISIDNIEANFKDILADEFVNYVLGMTKTCLLS